MNELITLDVERHNVCENTKSISNNLVLRIHESRELPRLVLCNKTIFGFTRATPPGAASKYLNEVVSLNRKTAIMFIGLFLNTNCKTGQLIASKCIWKPYLNV